MKVLAKITPDYLRDTIVEVRYVADLPYDILKGLLYQKLTEDYKLLSDTNPLGIIRFGNQQPLAFGRSESLDFTDDEIKIQLFENRITFNSMDAYQGWEKYFPKIQTLLKRLHGAKLLTNFKRIGVRYISEFPEIHIFDKIKLDLQLGFVEDEALFNTTFRTELSRRDHKVLINLANNVQRPKSKEGNFFSIIDIDVIGDIPDGSSLEAFFKRIDDLHTIEKGIFLNILKPEFLNSLNPEFE